VDIRRLRWDDVNAAKVRAHGLSPSVVDDMILVGLFEVFRDSTDHPAARRIVIGPTSRERLITLIVEPTETVGTVRPVTAYFSSPKEVRRYLARREQRRGSHREG